MGIVTVGGWLYGLPILALEATEARVSDASRSPYIQVTTPNEPAQSHGRATPQQVGTVMALLATFDEAGTLPPEGSREANQLIKALIQFQSAFMKSSHPEVRQYFIHALERKLGDQAIEVATTFSAEGWSSQTLEAVVEFGTQRGSWNSERLQDGLREFNLDLRDLDLLIRTYADAQQALISHGKDLHQLYVAKRREMPGSRTGR